MQENEKNWGFGLRRGNRDREEKTEEMDRNFNENNGFTGVRGKFRHIRPYLLYSTRKCNNIRACVREEFADGTG